MARGVALSCGYFRELSDRFADIREIFGIPRRGSSLRHRARSEIFYLIKNWTRYIGFLAF